MVDNKMDKNIILIGMMATGKSAVGKELALKLGRTFLDTDLLIEQKTGMTIVELFKNHGENCFRDHESEVIAGLKDYPRGSLVVATGGGAVIREENRNNMSRAGLLVHLKASPGEIVTRALQKGGRPLLDVEDPEAAVRAILEEREPYYSNNDICVNTENKSVKELAEEIIKKLQGC